MTLIPAKHTFTIWQGSTFFEVLTLYETNDKSRPRDFYDRNGDEPILLYSANMTIRSKPKSPPLQTNDEIDVVLSTDNNDIGTVEFPSDLEQIGKIHLILTDKITNKIDWKSGVYDLTITKDPDDVPGKATREITDTLLYGGIRVLGV